MIVNPKSLPWHLPCVWCSCSQTPADVYFLSDNTGTMTQYIQNVKTNATLILNNLTASVQAGSLWTGGGAYRDIGTDYTGIASNSPQRYDVFKNWANVALGTSGATAAINNWTAIYNNDLREGQLYALYQASCWFCIAGCNLVTIPGCYSTHL